MTIRIDGILKAIYFNQAKNCVVFMMQSGAKHELDLALVHDNETIDTIGLSKAGDEVSVLATSPDMCDSMVKTWENLTLTRWLSKIDDEDVAKAAAIFESLENGVRSRLVELGWTAEDGTAIASKEYPTAVGLKQALVYLKDYGPKEGSVLLTGEYQSEGRNCLSTTMVAIPRDATTDVISVLAQKFATEADVAVGQSYAARLHNLPDNT